MIVSPHIMIGGFLRDSSRWYSSISLAEVSHFLGFTFSLKSIVT